MDGDLDDEWDAAFIAELIRSADEDIAKGPAYRGGGRNECVFVKGRAGGSGGGGDALAAAAEAIAEARSLHAIRSALEDVEDHLEFLHMFKVQIS